MTLVPECQNFFVAMFQVLHLYHSFDLGTTWSERGSVAVHSTRSGSASVEQASLESEQVKAQPEKFPL